METGDHLDISSADLPIQTRSRKRGCLIALLITLVIIAGIWFIARPGVFTVQPIGAIPDGITVIYHSRGPQMPFFASPDGLCLEIQGYVSLLCRMATFSAVEEITDRIIVRLPYIDFAYLLSTDGQRFDQ